MTNVLGGRRAYAVWLAALSVYILAVFHRTSLGVAGLLAADRFQISGTQLATFTVLQLLVYAALQVPVGVLLDRFGSKKLILTGLALMTGGQLLFAVVGTFELGVLARVLVGAGDAMIFVSVIRVVALWFGERHSPLITQLTGQLGQVGAIAASFPLAAALHGVGWTPTFLAAALMGVVLAVVVVVVMRDAPGEEHPQLRLRAVGRSLRSTWDAPGTRLGLWSHFTSQFGMTVFTLLWGFPFLVRGQGLSEATAGGLLVLMTATQILFGPLLGGVVARHPYQRSHLVLAVVGAIADRLGRGPALAGPRSLAAAGRAGGRHRAGRTRVDGRFRPGPLVQPAGAHRQRSRGGQRRRLRRLTVRDGPGRHRPRPGHARWPHRLHAGRVPPGHGRAVPVLGVRRAPDLAVPAQGHRAPESSTSRRRSRPCATGSRPCRASRAERRLGAAARWGECAAAPEGRAHRGMARPVASKATGGRTSEAGTAYGYQPVAMQIGLGASAG